jgi:hypothetical protein
MKLKSYKHISLKILRYQNCWNSIQRKPSCSMRKYGRTDGHDEANSRFRQNCERAHKLTQNYHSCSVPCSQPVPTDRSVQVLPKFSQNPQTNSAQKREQSHKFFLPYSFWLITHSSVMACLWITSNTWYIRSSSLSPQRSNTLPDIQLLKPKLDHRLIHYHNWTADGTPWNLEDIYRRFAEVAGLPLILKFAGSNPAEAVGFLKGDKSPQHAFLWKGSKTIGPMSQICGMLKNPGYISISAISAHSSSSGC